MFLAILNLILMNLRFITKTQPQLVMFMLHFTQKNYVNMYIKRISNYNYVIKQLFVRILTMIGIDIQ